MIVRSVKYTRARPHETKKSESNLPIKLNEREIQRLYGDKTTTTTPQHDPTTNCLKTYELTQTVAMEYNKRIFLLMNYSYVFHNFFSSILPVARVCKRSNFLVSGCVHKVYIENCRNMNRNTQTDLMDICMI